VHVFQQLEGPGRCMVGFGQSVEPVNAAGVLFYRFNFKCI